MSAEQVKISGFGIGESGVLISCLPLDMLLSLSESSFPHLQGPDQSEGCWTGTGALRDTAQQWQNQFSSGTKVFHHFIN